MVEVHIDRSEVTRLAELLEQSPQVIEAAKEIAIAAAAPKMKAIVDQAIGGSGRVRSWQGQYVGSFGLYAAVRPRAKTYAEARKRQTWNEEAPNRYAVGYITNAINTGHLARPDKMGYRGKPISGKQFYQQAATRLGQVAEDAATNVCHAVASHLSSAKVHSGDVQPFTRNIGGKVYSFRGAGS